MALKHRPNGPAQLGGKASLVQSASYSLARRSGQFLGDENADVELVE